MPSLDTLKRRRRKKRRKKKRTRPGSAAWKRIKRRIGKLTRRIAREVRKRAWGGSKWIVAREVRPIVKRHGIRRTSGKRSETFGNPSSDHFVGNPFSYAEDYATANNQALAQEIRSKLDGGRHRDYESFYIKRRHRTGKAETYRVQIIAATHGTGPHLHVGIRRV